MAWVAMAWVAIALIFIGLYLVEPKQSDDEFVPKRSFARSEKNRP